MSSFSVKSGSYNIACIYDHGCVRVEYNYAYKRERQTHTHGAGGLVSPSFWCHSIGI